MRFIVLIVLCFLLSGCQLFNKYVTFGPKKDWDAEKINIQKEYDTKYQKEIRDILDKQKEKEQKEMANLQKASGLAFGIYQLSELKTVDLRSRPDSLINFKSKELVSRLPSLPNEEILKINNELKKELDEKITSLNDLQKKYNEALAQAEKDKQIIIGIQNEIKLKQNELKNIEKAKVNAELELETARRKTAEIEASEQARKAEDEAKKAELIKYLIRIFVGLGVGASIAAYATRSLILGGAAAGAFTLSIFIAFLEPWMIILAGSVLLIAVLTGIGVKWRRTYMDKIEEKELSDRLVGSIEEFKSKNGEDKFKNELAPHIQEWIQDMPELKGKIKSKLKELNLT
jgi:hypothetical protein